MNPDIHLDPRFSWEENWECVMDAIKENAERGVEVTPLTVISPNFEIIGWKLHGWTPPPGKVLLDLACEDKL